MSKLIKISVCIGGVAYDCLYCGSNPDEELSNEQLQVKAAELEELIKTELTRLNRPNKIPYTDSVPDRWKAAMSQALDEVLPKYGWCRV